MFINLNIQIQGKKILKIGNKIIVKTVPAV
jgi:hypothetical protein